MAKCSQCQAETELYISGVPVCVECAAKAENKAAQERKPPQPEQPARGSESKKNSA